MMLHSREYTPQGTLCDPLPLVLRLGQVELGVEEVSGVDQ